MKNYFRKLCLAGAMVFICLVVSAQAPRTDANMECGVGYHVCMELSEWDYVWDNAKCGKNINCQTSALMNHLSENDNCGRRLVLCIAAASKS